LSNGTHELEMGALGWISFCASQQSRERLHVRSWVMLLDWKIHEILPNNLDFRIFFGLLITLSSTSVSQSFIASNSKPLLDWPILLDWKLTETADRF
jgi:hypothetical protein